MIRILAMLGLVTLPALTHAADLPKPIVTGLKNPESIAVGPDGKIYVSIIGEFDQDGDGSVGILQNGKITPIVQGLDDPKGIAVFAKWLFIADKKQVWRIDLTPGGKRELLAPANAFPTEPKFLNDLVIDPESGTIYVSDSGDRKGNDGAVYRITMAGLVSVVTDTKRIPGLNIPNGLAMDGASHLILADFGAGNLYRVKLADGSAEKIAEGMDGADGLMWDPFGRLYISSWKTGKVFVIAQPGDKPTLLAEGFQSAADGCYQASTQSLLIPDMKAGTITAIPAKLPENQFNDTPLPLKATVAFPELKWAGWQNETDSGRPNPLRPIVLTHAGDGSKRIFVATEHGVIHVFPNEPGVKTTKVFLDIRDRVQYDDKQNEEGFLGLAFHPKYKETGEFFAFYTPKKEKNTNVISRFRVSKDDPDQADPASEEIILKFQNRPFWNHDGGTICFGPDGMLYAVHGDGGAGNDPYDNAQNLGNLLGKIVRIDINKKDEGKNYAVPKDNPFVGKEKARPEIWAYGLRNVWRMSFDRKTSQLWAADVGQNLYEEINLITRGGNYGWNRREAFHPFGARGTGPRPEFVDPIWEYHHDLGKSITGGLVYRGEKFPELQGQYVYGDYVSNKIWALGYDETKKRVVSNRPIKDVGLPIFSFGEDEQGEIYFLTATLNGKGIYTLEK